MKKRILTLTGVVALVLISVFAFTGCSSTPAHKLLRNLWDKNYTETAVYKRVTENEGDPEGTLTLSIRKLNDENVTSTDGVEFTDINGYIVTSDLKIGDDRKFTEVIMQGFAARHAYATSKVASLNEEYVLTADYGDKGYEYTVVLNGEEKKGEIKMSTDWQKSPYFDNAFFPFIARITSIAEKSTSMSVAVPTWQQNKALTFSSSIGSAVNVKDIPFITAASEDGTKCYRGTLTLNQKFPGSGVSFEYYYATEPIKLADGTDSLQYPLVKLRDNKITYVLTDLTVTR